jgi:NitT/TauT family transport system substrate-binding protein
VGIAGVLIFLVTLLLGGCGGGSGGGADTMTIAYQPGIGYAQLLIIKQEG